MNIKKTSHVNEIPQPPLHDAGTTTLQVGISPNTALTYELYPTIPDTHGGYKRDDSDTETEQRSRRITKRVGDALTMPLLQSMSVSDSEIRKKKAARISRRLSGLENKRRNRRTRPSHSSSSSRKVPSSKTGLFSTYCLCDTIDTVKMLEDFRVDIMTQDVWEYKVFEGSIVLASYLPLRRMEQESNQRAPPMLDERHVFYFPYGVVVLWGYQRHEEIELLKNLINSKHTVQHKGKVDHDDMQFSYGSKSKVGNDEIVLATHDIVEKLSISIAFAQSGKLSIFEDQVDKTIDETAHIPKDLASTGKIKLSRLEVSKLIGRLHLQRTDVNLHSDVLDTPDFFWDCDEWIPLFKVTSEYLDVEDRVNILNKRLDILGELLDILSNQLNEAHGNKLEWVIIWLIVIEVAVQVCPRFHPKPTSSLLACALCISPQIYSRDACNFIGWLSLSLLIHCYVLNHVVSLL